MEEIIGSAGVSGSAGAAETHAGAHAAPSAKASAAPNAKAPVIPSAEREESPASSSRLQREGDPSSASPPRDDRSGAKASVIPSASEEPPASSGRLQREGDPSSAAPPRDDRGGASAKASVIPSASEEPPASSSRLHKEGDPSSAAPPRDDRGCADGDGADGGRGLAVTFAARSARLADEAEALYAEWTAEAGELAKDYPAFDLAAAAKEPAFGRLLRAGVDLRTAYEATHMPQVREAIRVSAAAEAEARALDGVRLRGLRPDENGARPGGAVLTGGMAGLSREQRARIAERAMRGLL
ncbi:MAG: hypothetical protein IJU94_00060 [Clostridia bacterium]|nr:hypothetical protein [Clostridia bacterium]